MVRFLNVECVKIFIFFLFIIRRINELMIMVLYIYGILILDLFF